MKAKIKNAFEEIGFELEELDNFGCRFQYEGLNYLWMYSNDGDDYLNIALPGLLNPEKIGELIFYKFMDNLNSTLKFVKVNMLQDYMWFFYERELIGDEDLTVVIPRMISHLYIANDMLRDLVEKGMDDEEKNGDDSVNSISMDVDDIADVEIVTDGNNENDY